MKNMYIRKPVINHLARTISVTDTFMRAAAEPDSEAFNTYMRITAACPEYRVVVERRRLPKNKQPNLTYARMEKYISCLRDAKVNLEIFEKVKAFSKSQPNPYLTVSRWFNESFPDYGYQPEFDADGFPIVEANCVSLEAYKQQKEATAQQEGSNSEQIEA